ncbi:polysaccharide biosynthesis tyrosine autokinase [Sporosarcina limicola]|uniref:non-specific protein-tyrosine kinase n=1 Tax=Sporosarcina limicola TaxID=34101 RepID=A0A927MN95_9BACL|nr:polysaccharide biosynthesis tyrosine autokinase [Sporosarcina limicola]MBE1557083.1 capsular exopolysaccharide synthesis family protein [Sporosarcina limicola]
MRNGLDVKEIANLFKKKSVMIILVIFLFTLAGGVISYIIPPVYVAKTDLLVNYSTKGEGNKVLQSSDIEMSLRLIETYKQLLKSDRMQSKVIAGLKDSYTKTDLMNNISIESSGNSQIITIVAQEKTAEKAAILVNIYATKFQEEVKILMNLENINILNEISAGRDIKEVKPSSILFILISFIIGFILTGMIIVVQEFYFTKLNTVLRVENVLNTPNLGVIPLIKSQRSFKNKDVNWDERVISAVSSPFLCMEEFRRARANIQYHMAQKEAKAILVTSTVFGEGKSLVSGNLAVVMAMDGKRTVFVDANLRKPIGRRIFNLPERKGLTSMISGQFKLKEIIQKTEMENLFFISAGPIPPNPTEVLSSTKMEQLIDMLKEQFDVIIIDTPPLLVVDALRLSTFVDGCLYVIDAGRTKEEQASKSLKQLEKVGASILGTVLNRSYSTKNSVVTEY